MATYKSLNSLLGDDGIGYSYEIIVLNSGTSGTVSTEQLNIITSSKMSIIRQGDNTLYKNYTSGNNVVYTSSNISANDSVLTVQTVTINTITGEYVFSSKLFTQTGGFAEVTGYNFDNKDEASNNTLTFLDITKQEIKEFSIEPITE